MQGDYILEYVFAKEYASLSQKIPKQTPDDSITDTLKSRTQNLESLMRNLLIIAVILQMVVQGSRAMHYMILMIRSL